MEEARTKAVVSTMIVVFLSLLPVPVQAELVAHWKLDDGSGTTAVDSAGANNNGTLINSPTWVTGAVDGGGLDFDGTDDFVNAPVTGIPTGNSARTISVWFNADTLSKTDMKIFSYGDAGGGSEGGVGQAFAFTAESNGVWFRYSGGNNRYNLSGNTNLAINTWYHLAAVVPVGATESDDVLVYLNGTLANITTTGTLQTLNTNPTSEVPDFYLGHDGSASYFDGTLDDVRIYDTALISTEVQALYTEMIGNDETAPTLVDKTPAVGATEVLVNVKPTASFSEGIILESGGVITIRNLADATGSSNETITLPDARVSASGSLLVIDPTGNLEVSTPYAIRISGDAVKDLAGNFFVGIGNDTDWNFTTGTSTTPLNVLFVTYDDLNTWVEPIGGYPDVLTPQMTRLAAAGVTFRRAHCQAPICAPSRISFMTGLRPSTTGQYALGSRLSGVGAHKSLHESFKGAGYTTASIGKIYHNGGDLGSWLDLGNGNHNYGPFPSSKLTSSAVSGGNRMIDWGIYPTNDNQLEDYGFVTWALDRIEDFAASPETPFIMTVGMTQPHVPLFAPQAWFDLYPVSPERSFARPFYKADDLDDTPRFARYLHWNLPEPRTQTLIQYNEWDNHTRSYLACVSYADMNLGRLLDGLDDPNGDGNTSDSIRENTIVVMLSDHGYHLGEKGLTAKTSLWDRATHVPVIISAPGMAENQVCLQPIELLDLYPTLLDLCGLDSYAPLEGISLRPQLENPANSPRRPAITTHGPNNHSIVDERYRYTRYADGSEELYDHLIDPNEETNRIGDPNFREVAVRLAAFLPAVNAPNTSGTTRIAMIGAGDVISWEGSPINDTELGVNPAVANYVSPVAGEVPVDSDNDMMPDWWEIHYTGSIEILGPGKNKDGDPVPDADEYLHGTDPTNPASFLQTSIVPHPTDGYSVSHPTVPGRNYRFQTSGDLSNWNPDGSKTPGSGGAVVRSTDALGLPPGKGFIRVEVSSEADPSP